MKKISFFKYLSLPILGTSLVSLTCLTACNKKKTEEEKETEVVPTKYLNIKDNVLYGFNSDINLTKHKTIEIPEGVTTISQLAFFNLIRGSATIHKVIFPESLTSIETMAFNKCTKIDYLDFSKINKEKLANLSIGMSTFDFISDQGQIIFNEDVDDTTQENFVKKIDPNKSADGARVSKWWNIISDKNKLNIYADLLKESQPKTMYDAIITIEKHFPGLNFESSAPKSRDGKYYFDMEAKQFIILDSTGAILTAPDSYPGLPKDLSKIWKMVETIEFEEDGYSHYLKRLYTNGSSNDTKTITISTGFDIGKNEFNINAVVDNTYHDELIVRTYVGDLSILDKKTEGNIYQYGSVGTMKVNTIKNVFVHGVVGTIVANDGNITIEDDGETQVTSNINVMPNILVANPKVNILIKRNVDSYPVSEVIVDPSIDKSKLQLSVKVETTTPTGVVVEDVSEQVKAIEPQIVYTQKELANAIAGTNTAPIWLGADIDVQIEDYYGFNLNRSLQIDGRGHSITVSKISSTASNTNAILFHIPSKGENSKIELKNLNAIWNANIPGLHSFAKISMVYSANSKYNDTSLNISNCGFSIYDQTHDNYIINSGIAQKNIGHDFNININWCTLAAWSIVNNCGSKMNLKATNNDFYGSHKYADGSMFRLAYYPLYNPNGQSGTWSTNNTFNISKSRFIINESTDMHYYNIIECMSPANNHLVLDDCQYIFNEQTEATEGKYIIRLAQSDWYHVTNAKIEKYAQLEEAERSDKPAEINNVDDYKNYYTNENGKLSSITVDGVKLQPSKPEELDKTFLVSYIKEDDGQWYIPE